MGVVDGRELSQRLIALEKLRRDIVRDGFSLTGRDLRRFQVDQLVKFWDRWWNDEGPLTYEAAALMALRQSPPIAFSPKPEHLPLLVVRLALGCTAKDASMVSRAVDQVWESDDREGLLDSLGGVNGAAWKRRPRTAKMRAGGVKSSPSPRRPRR